MITALGSIAVAVAIILASGQMPSANFTHFWLQRSQGDVRDQQRVGYVHHHVQPLLWAHR